VHGAPTTHQQHLEHLLRLDAAEVSRAETRTVDLDAQRAEQAYTDPDVIKYLRGPLRRTANIEAADADAIHWDLRTGHQDIEVNVRYTRHARRLATHSRGLIRRFGIVLPGPANVGGQVWGQDAQLRRNGLLAQGVFRVTRVLSESTTSSI